MRQLLALGLAAAALTGPLVPSLAADSAKVGATKTVACGGMDSAIIALAHDDEHIYYARFTPDLDQAIRSVKLAD